MWGAGFLGGGRRGRLSEVGPRGAREGGRACSDALHPGPKPLNLSDLPLILLVDRGDCYFIEKAFNAERAGAKAVIVADYKASQDWGPGWGSLARPWPARPGWPVRTRHTPTPTTASPNPFLQDEKLLTMAAPDDRPEVARLKNDITIPTALVTQAVGAKLRAAAKGGVAPTVELDWTDSVVNPDDRVEWEL